MSRKRHSRAGRLALEIESVVANLPVGIPCLVGDLISRASGEVMNLANVPLSDGAEERIRGILSASRFGTTGLRIGRGVILRGSKNIKLGSDVLIGDRSFISATGSRGRVEIGDNTHVDVGCVLYGQGGLSIGNDCAIASGVIVYTQTNRYDANPAEKILEQGTRYAAVQIGNDVWIGAGARILPGVTIGDHAVVGAGAVVNRNVEGWKVVVGQPARVVKDRRGDTR